jgi:hypothetical protein
MFVSACEAGLPGVIVFSWFSCHAGGKLPAELVKAFAYRGPFFSCSPISPSQLEKHTGSTLAESSGTKAMSNSSSLNTDILLQT